ncbi:type II toxin-antitoxin system prevent-host-death family antitoxin [Phenylobacterium terrae]|uniref:Type II toxin-antitoxin system prevent-host-death family antitoxin n=2 Tax=Phenylobacterium terrae TaxID=2665495 RepID=A0ABW4MX08_9CAUL
MGGSIPNAVEVTAAAISRNFGTWQDKAMTTPVIVTKHGKPRVVLLSADAYCAARAPQNDQSSSQPTLDWALATLLDNINQGFVALDRELRILSVNRAFCVMAERGEAHLVGRSLEEAFPKSYAIVHAFLHQTMADGEVADFEAPSALASGRFYRVRAFPYLGGVAVLLQSRREEVLERETRQRLESEVAAFRALPGACWAAINLRGRFTEVGQGLAHLTGLAAEDLAGLQLVQIIRPAARHTVAAAIEAVIDQRQAQSLTSAVLSKGLDETPVHLALSPVLDNGAVTGISMVAQTMRDGSASPG